MNYSGKKIAITGATGFIGGALYNHPALDNDLLHSLGGDIRNPSTFAGLDHTYDYLFHFAAPSSQIQFKRDPAHCIETTVKGIMNAANAAKQHGIRLVYPSTGLLSSDRYNEYALCKKLCEDYVAGMHMDAIGLRIFATYGPGEGHKRDYASVPYLFARDMVAGKRPVIFGDGEQTRDFIYIDDTVQAILTLAEECSLPVVDIGSGQPWSFKGIVHDINRVLFRGDSSQYIKPVYIKAPGGYVQDTLADPETMANFYRPEADFMTGITRLIEHLKEED